MIVVSIATPASLLVALLLFPAPAPTVPDAVRRRWKRMKSGHATHHAQVQCNAAPTALVLPAEGGLVADPTLRRKRTTCPMRL